MVVPIGGCALHLLIDLQETLDCGPKLGTPFSGPQKALPTFRRPCCHMLTEDRTYSANHGA